MKFRFITVLLILISTVLTSCSEDVIELKTSGEIIGEHLQELVDEQNVQVATTYLIDYRNDIVLILSDEFQESFTIDRQVIKVGSTYYNLDKLTKYEITTNGVLELYFEGFLR